MTNQNNCEIRYTEHQTALRITIDLPLNWETTNKPDTSASESKKPTEDSNEKKVGFFRRLFNRFDLSTRATVMDTIVQIQERIEYQERQLGRLTDYTQNSSQAQSTD
ncbi:hypothetical protein HMPREF2736_06450 [Corynebacterium sp. HMSC036E10]|uniref:hypothetical protein n=1 Tax=Corynebacterium sp. HMSC036E10 TaxID=1715215 RepID=UPI0008A83733|nr:hypothetical protein [Corynebacterium sp. HMSC036E10]OHO81563.1 hypothetical protein HMPREF2736_06450 [Corynebacterium sp. HMSC036E10]